MPELIPTVPRLRLLGQVANGQVLNDIASDRDDDPIVLFPHAPGEWQTRQRVTSAIRELERADWVQEDQAGIEWQTTDKGQAVLAAATETMRG